MKIEEENVLSIISTILSARYSAQIADVEPEYQDAFGETNGYHPIQPKKTVPQDWEQMELQL